MLKTISYQGKTLAYEFTGNGLPVMLVHGFTEDRRIWDHLVSSIGKKYQLLIPDLPGSGDSAFNPNLHTIADFAGVLRAIQLEEKTGPFILIGHSMGGYISLAFADAFPDALKGLGLFHSSAYEDSAEKKLSRQKSIIFIRKQGSAPFVEQSLPGLFSGYFKERHPEKIQKQIDLYANFNPDSLVQYLEAMMNREDRTRVLKGFGGPVLFIMGEEDKAVPLKDSLEQSHLPQISYIHILSHTAHMGMLESSNLCNSFVDRFLDPIPV